jgi:hypothetical protein
MLRDALPTVQFSIADDTQSVRLCGKLELPPAKLNPTRHADPILAYSYRALHNRSVSAIFARP